jgi:hypothetical protein
MRAVIVNFNGILDPLYDTFEQAELKELIEDKKPDCLITWTDYPADFKMLCLIALQNGVPTFMVQHGRRAMRDYWTHQGDPTSVACFVWGGQDREDAIAGGWHPHQVFRIGAPWLIYKPERKEEKGLIVYDAPHWHIDTMESKKTWAALKKIKGIRPIVKLISPSEQKRTNYLGEQLLTFRDQPGHIEATYKLLARASAVVCMMESTLELMAISLGVPVIHVKGFKHKKLAGTWQGVEDTVPGKGSLACDIDGLDDAIRTVMDNPTLLADEARQRLLADAGDPSEDRPIETITTVITELVTKYKNEKNTIVQK